MKAYPSCLLELHPPFVGVGAAGCDLDTTTPSCSSAATSSSIRQRKRNRRLSTPYFTAAALTGKRVAATSIFAHPSFPFFPPRHLIKLKLTNPCRKYCCSSSSSNDTDSLEVELGIGGNELFEPSIDSDTNSEEVVEFYGRGVNDLDPDAEILSLSEAYEEDGIEIQITNLGKRSRRIHSSIRINASLSTIWDVLTDYERLADFIPGLAVSRLLEKRDNFARLFQIGQQNLALGLKFNAKAVLDCYEKDLEILSFGQRRDIEFKMVEGDFQTFEGKWSIEQYDAESCDASQDLGLLEGQKFHTILSYVVDVEPKMWLPVRLVEGRLCSEIKTNLSCIRQAAQIRPPVSCS